MKLPVTEKASTWLFPNLGEIRGTREFTWAKWALVSELLIGGIVLAIFWRSIPPKIPLWYSRPWGDERLASPWWLLLPLFSALAVYVINLMLISKNLREHPMFARILLLTSCVVSLIAVMTVTRIVLLVS